MYFRKLNSRLIERGDDSEKKVPRYKKKRNFLRIFATWISPDYFESLLLPQ